MTTAIIVIIVAPLRLIHLLSWLMLLFPLGDAPKIIILLPFSILTLCSGLGCLGLARVRVFVSPSTPEILHVLLLKCEGDSDLALQGSVTRISDRIEQIFVD